MRYDIGGNGTVDSCTVVSNFSYGTGAGVYLPASAIVSNSIVYFNVSRDGVANIAGPTNISYTCASPAPSGTGNTGEDPQFVSVSNCNFHLIYGSPCIDTAASNSWMNGAKDIDGQNRVVNGVPDMGADEFVLGALSCKFTADKVYGFYPLSVVLTGVAIGANLDGLDFLWDLNNDGTIDVQGANKAIITNAFNPGTYSVALTVTNAIGESNTYRRLSYIKTGVATAYVWAASSSPVAPYVSWATAATGILEGVNAATDGSLVLVSNGTYGITSTIVVANSMRIEGVAGAANTIVWRTAAGTASPQHRIFTLTSSNIVIKGLTITNGYFPNPGQQAGGAGVYVSGSDCVILDSSILNNGSTAKYGGGIFAEDTADRLIVSNCTISGNTCGNYGAGIHLNYSCTDSKILNCVISSNSCINAGGIAMFGANGLVQNCTVFDNSAPGFGGGVFVYSANSTVRNSLIYGNSGRGVGSDGVGYGTVESCTVVSNYSTGAGAGVFLPASSIVLNSIVYFNKSRDGVTTNIVGPSTISYTCATPAPSGTDNTGSDPSFVNFGAKNYRLLASSPCINTGTNVTWMIGAKDLDGKKRIVKSRVDMGAYETPPPAGTVVMIRNRSVIGG